MQPEADVDWKSWGQNLGDAERPPTRAEKIWGSYTTTANCIRQLRFGFVSVAVVFAIVLFIKLV
jgi:hypothetical protein